MNLVCLRTLNLFVTLLIASSVHAEEITFESDVKVKREGESSFATLKTGEHLKLKTGESALVTTSQGFPMLIYSPKSSSAEIHVADVNLEVFAQDQLRPQLDKATKEIVAAIHKTDTLLQRREYDQALAAITPVRAKYPSISSVLFASGTANYLTNHKQSAIDDLQKGLELDPDDAAAKKLLQRLKEEK